MTIVRIEKRPAGFAQIDNRVLSDPRLSWKAKGLLVYLLSKPSNWHVRMGDLVKRSPDGEHAVRSGLKELLGHGYATRQQPKGEGSKFQEIEWVVREIPHGGFPHAEKPDAENPHAENHGHSNTDSTDTDCSNTDSNTPAAGAAENSQECPSTNDICPDCGYQTDVGYGGPSDPGRVDICLCETSRCPDCCRPYATTPETPRTQDCCTCRQRAELAEAFPRDDADEGPVKPSPGWKEFFGPNLPDWLNPRWGEGKIQPRPESGAEVVDLQVMGCVVEHHTGLQMPANGGTGYSNGLAALFEAAGGDWEIIERAVVECWGREPQFRPATVAQRAGAAKPNGFAVQAGKLAAEKRWPDACELQRQAMDPTPEQLERDRRLLIAKRKRGKHGT